LDEIVARPIKNMDRHDKNEKNKYHSLQHSQSVVLLVQQPTTVEFLLDPCCCWMPFCEQMLKWLINWLNETTKE
jgi:hypothetical protein